MVYILGIFLLSAVIKFFHYFYLYGVTGTFAGIFYRKKESVFSFFVRFLFYVFIIMFGIFIVDWWFGFTNKSKRLYRKMIINLKNIGRPGYSLASFQNDMMVPTAESMIALQQEQLHHSSQYKYNLAKGYQYVGNERVPVQIEVDPNINNNNNNNQEDEDSKKEQLSNTERTNEENNTKKKK